MSYRQLVLDTETTGLKTEEGHRIIEIACIELINRRLTGQHFHFYINPERDIDQGATNIHGLTRAFLKDKPPFADIAQSFIDFVAGSELIIHNAPFDIGFLNYELGLLKKGFKKMMDYCPVIDTLVMARARHMGQRNSLDALCKRYKIDCSERQLHGALLDTHLLAQVYLAMTGGQGDFFDALNESSKQVASDLHAHLPRVSQAFQLQVTRADQDEQEAHATYLLQLAKKGKCVWNDDGPQCE